MKDVTSVTTQELDDFVKSFDYIFYGFDGVEWDHALSFPGAIPALAALRSLNKKIIIVSNQTIKLHDEIHQELTSSSFEIDKNDLITPEIALVSYLKKIKFEREIYFLGTKALRSALVNSGFKVEEGVPYSIDDTAIYVKLALTINRNVGAVITDLDFNSNRLKLNKAGQYLRKDDVLYITVNPEKGYLKGDFQEKIFGCGYFDGILEEFTGRRALRLAKPSTEYGKFIQEKLGIVNPSRVLLIGTSVEEDMAFANNCGYKKLLVTNGRTSETWPFAEELMPEYYVDSLQAVADLFVKI